jgi:hypothetical protein
LKHCAWHEPEGLGDLEQQSFTVERFGQIAEYPPLHSSNRIRDRSMRSQDDDWQSGRYAMNVFEQGHSIHATHSHIANDQLWARHVEIIERYLSTWCCFRLVADGHQADRE